MTMSYFKKNDSGQYEYYIDDSLTYTANTLAFLADKNSGVIKHGDFGQIMRAFKELNEDDPNCPDLRNLVIVSDRNWDVETINKFIQITGYFSEWYLKNRSMFESLIQ